MFRSQAERRGRPARPPLGLAGGLGPGLILLLAGCRGPSGPAAASIDRIDEEEQAWKRVLTPAEEAEATAAMRSVARGHTVVERPAPAPPAEGGMRWSDLRAAVAGACRDVEAAVVHVAERDDGAAYRFDIRTIEDWPAALTVERVPAPEVYRAAATVGRFPDEPARRARAEALLAALAAHMKAFGAKRAFAED
jgi:hypothetical protein